MAKPTKFEALQNALNDFVGDNSLLPQDWISSAESFSNDLNNAILKKKQDSGHGVLHNPRVD